jgi:sec-independent protein translocase protein TatC
VLEESPNYNHLTELRTRLIKIILIIIIGLMATFTYGDILVELLLSPLRTFFITTGEGKVIYTGLVDKILSQFQVSTLLSIVLTSPLWFYQIWKFVKPALYQKELKVVRPFIFIGFTLFCAGVYFGHFIVLPLLIKTFTEFGVSEISANINLKDYLLLTCKLMLLFGTIFQIPNLILLLRLIGVVDSEFLSKNRKYIYIGLTVASGIITPPDVLTMFMLLGPLIALYEFGILISWIFLSKSTKQEQSC